MVGRDYGSASIGLISDSRTPSFDDVVASAQDDSAFPSRTFLCAREDPKPHVLTGCQAAAVFFFVVLTFGLVFATLLTLVIVPALNLIFMDIRAKVTGHTAEDEFEAGVD